MKHAISIILDPSKVGDHHYLIAHVLVTENLAGIGEKNLITQSHLLVFLSSLITGNLKLN